MPDDGIQPSCVGYVAGDRVHNDTDVRPALELILSSADSASHNDGRRTSNERHFADVLARCSKG